HKSHSCSPCYGSCAQNAYRSHGDGQFYLRWNLSQCWMIVTHEMTSFILSNVSNAIVTLIFTCMMSISLDSLKSNRGKPTGQLRNTSPLLTKIVCEDFSKQTHFVPSPCSR
ncbi:unnamed protein product, partial [Choristocarpus tenellus]